MAPTHADLYRTPSLLLQNKTLRNANVNSDMPGTSHLRIYILNSQISQLNPFLLPLSTMATVASRRPAISFHPHQLAVIARFASAKTFTSVKMTSLYGHSLTIGFYPISHSYIVARMKLSRRTEISCGRFLSAMTSSSPTSNFVQGWASFTHTCLSPFASFTNL